MIKRFLLGWLIGFATILDGLVQVLTLGFYTTDFALTLGYLELKWELERYLNKEVDNGC